MNSSSSSKVLPVSHIDAALSLPAQGSVALGLARLALMAAPGAALIALIAHAL